MEFILVASMNDAVDMSIGRHKGYGCIAICMENLMAGILRRELFFLIDNGGAHGHYTQLRDQKE